MKNVIIDSHIHYGKLGKDNLTEDKILDLMDKNNINFGIVSSCDCGEYEGDEENTIRINENLSQLEINKELLDIVKKHHNLKMKFWIRPKNERLDDETKNFILENKDKIVALKMHPYHSRLEVNDPNMVEYLEFCNDYDIPIAVHTAIDKYSKSKYLCEVAKKYPNVLFICVHMELGSNHLEATKYVKEIDNLYADTTWVKYECTLKIIEEVGVNKVLFGTDAPISDYTFYKLYFENYKNIKDIFHKNILEVFNFAKKD